jgi:Cyclic phosphodiesterase-like protein
MQVTLWLLPPASTSELLQANIAELAQKYEGSCPFVPHVTVVGIPCESSQELLNLSAVLKQGLQGFGGIPCRFRKELITMTNPDNTLVWNQACVSVMERSKEFMLLTKRVRELLGIEGEESEFPAPLGEPHLSHYYGKQKAPCAQDVIAIPDFVAGEVALWDTSGGFEGVKNWKELAKMKL